MTVLLSRVGNRGSRALRTSSWTRLPASPPGRYLGRTLRGAMPHASLFQIIERLERHYGPPRREPPCGPFEMILWEIVAYLADDDTRRAAFQALQAQTRCDPRRILSTPLTQLEKITRRGGSIAPGERAERLHRAAWLVQEEFNGDLSLVLKLPLPKAKKALMQFPMTG